jgi:hypothetical protein
MSIVELRMMSTFFYDHIIQFNITHTFLVVHSRIQALPYTTPYMRMINKNDNNTPTP